jgi:uncharacterized protein
MAEPSRAALSIYADMISTRLVAAYHPERIYVFGSYAWGEPRTDSDIDLLVVVDTSDEKPYRRPVRGLKALRDLGIPKDLLVYTGREFEESASEPSSLAHRVREQGALIYERS